MVKLVHVIPQVGFKVQLQYDDGANGVVDLSDVVGRGVFKPLIDIAVFRSATVGRHGELRWSDEMELCGDALYLQMTGKSLDDIFPGVRNRVDA